ncbi:hypothetical protein KDN24_06240 [Bacillus sp. Bva_UNVM-123]|uniref:hypothetical protein n=1 Tax=Bacillus sp. Bva_UNVM-123 TaxID=2829798 RepID=UPI00391EE8D5
MNNLIKFNHEDQVCKKCELINSYFDDIVNSKSPEQLFTSLSDLVNDALEYFGEELFQDGFDVGSKIGCVELLKENIKANQELIKEK